MAWGVKDSLHCGPEQDLSYCMITNFGCAYYASEHLNFTLDDTGIIYNKFTNLK